MNVTCKILKGISLHSACHVFKASEGYFTNDPNFSSAPYCISDSITISTSATQNQQKRSTRFVAASAPSICWCSMFSSKFTEPSVNSNDFAVALKSIVSKKSTELVHQLRALVKLDLNCHCPVKKSVKKYDICSLQ